MAAESSGFAGSLNELIDISAFTKLSESFSRLTGLATAILDLEGDILASAGWKRICTEYHRKNAVTAARCRESDTLLAGRAMHGGQCNVYKCENGLVDVAVPIVIEDEHVGNLFIGQFFLGEPSLDYFTRQAGEIGFDRDSYLCELRQVPVISMDCMNQAVDFMKNLTTIIGGSGLDRKKLFTLNGRLEQRIQERTAELSFSNERLRVFSEASFEGIIITEKGVVIEANNRVAAMIGYVKGAELVGERFSRFIAPDRRADVDEKVRSGYEKPYESLALTKDGTVFPVEIHGRTFPYKGRLVRGSAIRDLTERKRAEMEIQALRNILPICSFCKKIRNDRGYWEQVDTYFQKHANADFSHGICPECMKKHYPEESGG